MSWMKSTANVCVHTYGINHLMSPLMSTSWEQTNSSTPSPLQQILQILNCRVQPVVHLDVLPFTAQTYQWAFGVYDLVSGSLDLSDPSNTSTSITDCSLAVYMSQHLTGATVTRWSASFSPPVGGFNAVSLWWTRVSGYFNKLHCDYFQHFTRETIPISRSEHSFNALMEKKVCAPASALTI